MHKNVILWNREEMLRYFHVLKVKKWNLHVMNDPFKEVLLNIYFKTAYSAL